MVWIALTHQNDGIKKNVFTTQNRYLLQVVMRSQKKRMMNIKKVIAPQARYDLHKK